MVLQKWLFWQFVPCNQFYVIYIDDAFYLPTTQVPQCHQLVSTMALAILVPYVKVPYK